MNEKASRTVVPIFAIVLGLALLVYMYTTYRLRKKYEVALLAGLEEDREWAREQSERLVAAQLSKIASARAAQPDRVKPAPTVTSVSRSARKHKNRHRNA